MSAFDTSLPIPPSGTGSFVRNVLGIQKESEHLSIGKPHWVTRDAIDSALFHIKYWRASRKTPIQKKNMISILLFKTAMLGLKTGENAINIVRNLVWNGADIHIKNKFGATPLMIACMFGNIEMVTALLLDFTVIKDTDNARRTAFDWIGGHGSIEPDLYFRIKQLLTDAVDRAKIHIPSIAEWYDALPSSSKSYSVSPANAPTGRDIGDIFERTMSEFKKIYPESYEEIYGAFALEHPSASAEANLNHAWYRIHPSRIRNNAHPSSKPYMEYFLGWLMEYVRFRKAAIATVAAAPAAPVAAPAAGAGAAPVAAPAAGAGAAPAAGAGAAPLPALARKRKSIRRNRTRKVL